jgi:DNA-binding phage protein
LTDEKKYATISMSQKCDEQNTGGKEMVINKVRGAVYARYKDIATLAEVLGWSRQKLSPIVNGKKEPDLAEVQAMADAMCMDASILASFFLELKSQNCDK